MKLSVFFNIAQELYDAANDHACMSAAELPLCIDEKEAVIEVRRQQILDRLDKWVEYEEEVTIEFDLDTMTAKVLEVKRPVL